MGTLKAELGPADLKDAIDSACVALMVVDRTGRITYANEATRRIFSDCETEVRKRFSGFSSSRMVGAQVDFFRDLPEPTRSVLADPHRLPHQVRIPLGDAQLDVTVSAHYAADGEYVGQSLLWKDVTASARADAERERTLHALQHLKQASDHASVALMMCDCDFNITYANAATIEILSRNESELRKVYPGFSSASIVGTNMDRFHKHPEHQRRVLSDPRNLPYRAKMGVGSVRFEVNAGAVWAPDGSAAGYILEWRDITDQVEAESALQGLIEAAAKGSLAQRFDTDDRQGFVRQVGDRINTLLDAVAGPIDDVRAVTEAVAEGRLTHRVEKEYQGDFGNLAQSLNRSIDNLQELVSQISHSSGEIARAAGEISAGNANLSSRTQEQAAALEETASTVEELTSTVKQNAESARHADQLASTARDMAATGGKVVTLAVEAMSEINRSSKRIADIIGVIDEIAFQTNLLALNAAVEAARAGDHGRGFAVVATEVRNLAQRSANAAREIKSLIKDSLDKVDDGKKLVDRSGATLEGIVASVKKVSDIVAEIAAASDEQASGIVQVNQAIAQMDDATQQNAALVEQAAAAAAAMDDQTKNLQHLVQTFEVPEIERAPSEERVSPVERPKVGRAPNASRPARPKPPALASELSNGHGRSREREWEEF